MTPRSEPTTEANAVRARSRHVANSGMRSERMKSPRDAVILIDHVGKSPRLPGRAKLGMRSNTSQSGTDPNQVGRKIRRWRFAEERGWIAMREARSPRLLHAMRRGGQRHSLRCARPRNAP